MNPCPFIPHLCGLFLLAVAALFSIFLILAFSKVLYKWNHAIGDLSDKIFPQSALFPYDPYKYVSSSFLFIA